MAFQGTKLNNLLDPQVIGAFLDVKLIDAIKLSPLVGVDRTLEGRPGSTLTLPKFDYIGSADDVAEGEAMVPVALSETSVTVKVKKAGKAVSISDEAILSGYGDPVNEIGRQLLMAMAEKIEKDLYAEMEKATQEVVYTTFNKDVIVDAQLKFGEDINEPMFLLVNSAEYAVLRKDKDFVQIMNGLKIIGLNIFINKKGGDFMYLIETFNKKEDDKLIDIENGGIYEAMMECELAIHNIFESLYLKN